MTPARWRRIEELFDSTVELEPSRRKPFLVAACADDEELRREVECLLACHERGERFLELPALEVAAQSRGGEPWSMPAQLAGGERLGPYRIIAPLGAGGMGEVYSATDTRLGRKVAVKLLPQQLARDAQALERFQREARAASALNHPNICALYDVGEREGQPFLVLELLEGQTLKERLGTGPLPVGEVVALGVQIADALEAAHSKGIVHRDLKPANIFVTPRGEPKILDFGLAKRLSEPARPPDAEAGAAAAAAPAEATISIPGWAAGTVAYMSPEQARGEAVDERSDLFSLGVTLYQMATGKLPFQGETLAEIFPAILNQTPRPPQELNPSLPPRLGRVILRALEKDRRARYQSAAEMRLDLADLNAGRGKRLGRRAVLAAGMVAVAGLLGGGLLYFGSFWSSGVKSLAVLPIENRSASPDDEYLADGLTEALTDAMAKIHALRVISRTSAARYKDTDAPLPDIARELGVDALVKGSLVRSGSRFEVRVQLLGGDTGEHLWAESYERDLSDVGVLQNEVARAVAKKIGVAVSPEEQAWLAKARRVNREAFEAYFRGRHAWNKWTPEDIHKAIRWFQAAIDADPVFAPAYAGLADCYNQLGTVFLNEGPPSKTRPLAVAAAKKALEFDEELAEGHAALAYTDLYNWNWARAEAGFRRAIELNPSYALARLWYAQYLTARGRHDEALREVYVARDLDPLSPIIQTQVGWLFGFAGRFEEALREYPKALELDPNYVWAYWQTGITNMNLSKHEEAIRALQKALELSGLNPSIAASLGQAYAVAGRKADAQTIVNELTALSERRYVSPWPLVGLLLEMGDMDRGFEWLEKSYAERSKGLAFFAVLRGPGWERVRQDPRGQNLMRRIGLTGSSM